MVYISPLAKLSFIMSAVTFLRAQHGLARCGGESENEDGIRVDLTFNSGMRGKTFSVAAGFAYLDRRGMRDSFRIDCGE